MCHVFLSFYRLPAKNNATSFWCDHCRLFRINIHEMFGESLIYMLNVRVGYSIQSYKTRKYIFQNLILYSCNCLPVNLPVMLWPWAVSK